MKVPHFAGSLDCDCLGCRGDIPRGGAVDQTEHPRLPPLPPLSEGACIDPIEATKRDEPVLALFAGSYLAPLLPMARSLTWEIRRGAITSLARLSDDHQRAAVASLRNLQGRSVLVDVISYGLSKVCTSIQRREAVVGLVNLLGHVHAQAELRAENLLGEFKRLCHACKTDSQMALVVPVLIRAVEGLCRNQSLSMAMVRAGFAPRLLLIAEDTSGGDGIIAGGVRRAAVNSLTALSQNTEARVELKKQGALRLAVSLLASTDAYLRRAGGTLAANVCLHPDNKVDALNSPLLPQMLASALSPHPGEDGDLSLALAALFAEPSLLPRLASPATTRALLSLLQRGSREASRHAATTFAV